MLRIAHSTQSTLFLCISTAPQSPNHDVASSTFKAWRTDGFYYGLGFEVVALGEMCIEGMGAVEKGV